MSQFIYGPEGIKMYNEYFDMLFKFFHNLEKTSNLNPNISKTKIETDKRIFYSDQLRLLVNKLDYIVRTPDIFDSFLNDTKKHDFNKITFLQIYGSLFLYSILINYTNIENLFLTMLQNTKMNVANIVKGTEPLGPLLKKIFQLDTNHVLNESDIRQTLDTSFRNSLAHGWLRIENREIIYSKEFDSPPLKLDYAELFERMIKLDIFGMALYHVIFGKKWTKSTNFN
jgi:hypothetical protein